MPKIDVPPFRTAPRLKALDAALVEMLARSSSEERRELIVIIVDCCDGRMQIVIGFSSNIHPRGVRLTGFLVSVISRVVPRGTRKAKLLYCMIVPIRTSQHGYYIRLPVRLESREY